MTKKSEYTVLQLERLLEVKKLLSDKKTRKQGMDIIWKSTVLNHACEHQIQRILGYYGCPEFKPLYDRDYHYNNLKLTSAEKLADTIESYDVDKMKELTEGRKKTVSEAVTIGSYLYLNAKHEMISYVCESSKEYYPEATAYYQELMILAHKGGIEGRICDSTVEEVKDAINRARYINYLKTCKKRGTPKTLFNDNISEKQAEKVMKVYSDDYLNYVPRHRGDKTLYKSAECSQSELLDEAYGADNPTLSNDCKVLYDGIEHYAKSIFSKEEFEFFELWFDKVWFGKTKTGLNKLSEVSGITRNLSENEKSILNNLNLKTNNDILICINQQREKLKIYLSASNMFLTDGIEKRLSEAKKESDRLHIPVLDSLSESAEFNPNNEIFLKLELLDVSDSGKCSNSIFKENKILEMDTDFSNSCIESGNCPDEGKNFNLYLQYAGRKFSKEQLFDRCKSDASKKIKTPIKDMNVYCKPEEQKAYYVVHTQDGIFEGNISL